MTDRFLQFMPFILEWEGGYENDPDDPGGETKYGIDKRSHPNEDIRHLSVERATEIYWDSYWAPIRGDLLPAGVGEVCMNIAVNAGKARAARWLQQAVGATPDGQIGPKTIQSAAEFQSRDGKSLATILLDRTEEHYRSIAHGRLYKFLRGWLNRNNALRNWIAAH